MATVAHLLRLPPELMLRISHPLTTHDLGCFRLACKQIETNLFESFAREFFSKRQFMIEDISLQALVDIANHRTLAPYFKDVIISLDTLHDNRAGNPNRNINREVLLATGRARDMLVSAFSKLPNLRSVGIRDYDAKGRQREGDDALWRSYGWSSAGNASRRSFRSRASPDTVLPLLLYALGEASAKPESIEVFLRRGRLPDCSFDLRPAFMQSKTIPVLSSLKALLLSLEDSSPHRLPVDPFHNPPVLDEDGFCHLKDFLQHVPLLEHLRLNFASNSMPSPISEDLLAWLATSAKPGLTLVPKPPTFDHLTEINIGMARCTPGVLLRLVTKFTTLKVLALWKVSLHRDRDSAFEPDTAGMWSYCLPKLGQAFQAPENISSVKIGWAAEVVGPYEIQTVRFADKISTDSNGERVYEDLETTVEYRKRVGDNVVQWFEELGEKAYTPPPVDSSSDSSDISDSDSEAMDGAAIEISDDSESESESDG